MCVAPLIYVYQTVESNPYSAENWNLASPIATCSLLVERRGDCLVLEFRQNPDDIRQQQQLPTTFGSNLNSPIYAQAVIDCSVQTSSSVSETNDSSSTLQQQQRKIKHWIDGTIDSSRYFTLRISNGGREALIGFGFRDRDQAIDLRESLQHYEASMRREFEASIMSNNSTNSSTATISKYTIPKLADGERIHIRTGKSSDSDQSTKSKSTDNSTKILTGRPILLKKPPPSASTPSLDDTTSTMEAVDDKNNQCIMITTATMAQHGADTKDNPVIRGNEAAAADDDDDWETEFVSAS